jgi:hypothetical protein
MPPREGSRTGLRAALQSGGLPGFRDVEQLAGLRRELAQQLGESVALPDARDVENIPHDHEVHVVPQQVNEAFAAGSQSGSPAKYANVLDSR